MAFLNEGLSTAIQYISTNLRFIFPVPEAAHLRAGTGCREQRLKQLELLCHLLGTASFDIAARTGSRTSPPCSATDIFDKELVPLLLTAIDVQY